MKFAEKVKYARMKLLLTQEALAKELGVSYATICRWEKDNREPHIQAGHRRPDGYDLPPLDVRTHMIHFNPPTPRGVGL